MTVCVLQTNEGYVQKDFRRIEGIEIIATNCIVLFLQKQFYRSGLRAKIETVLIEVHDVRSEGFIVDSLA